MGKYSIEITDANFEQLVLNSDKPVLVDFWAEWCGPCLMVAPIIEEVASEYEGRFVVGKMDVDNNSEIPMQYGILNIPTLLFFKGGNVIDKHVGTIPKSALKSKMEAILA